MILAGGNKSSRQKLIDCRVILVHPSAYPRLALIEIKTFEQPKFSTSKIFVEVSKSTVKYYVELTQMVRIKIPIRLSHNFSSEAFTTTIWRQVIRASNMYHEKGTWRDERRDSFSKPSSAGL